MNRLTGKVASMAEMIDLVRSTPELMSQVTYWHTIPPREARYAEFPEGLHVGLRESLRRRGVSRLYTHQAAAFREAELGRHVVTVTPTASGKTLCYNLPVLQRILQDDSARALYLFPTKALAQDQVAEMQELVEVMGVDIKTHPVPSCSLPSA